MKNLLLSQAIMRPSLLLSALLIAPIATAAHAGTVEILPGLSVNIKGEYPTGQSPRWSAVSGTSVDTAFTNYVAKWQGTQQIQYRIVLMQINGRTGIRFDGDCFAELDGLPALLTERPRTFRLINFHGLGTRGKPGCSKMSAYWHSRQGQVSLAADADGNLTFGFSLDVISARGQRSYHYESSGQVLANGNTPSKASATYQNQQNAEKERALAVAKAKAEMDRMIALANAGNVDAMIILADKYGSGDGVARDTSERIRWLRRAATAGRASAMFDLGVALSEGSGVQQNATEAAKWFKGAAAKGVVEAMFNLGIMAKKGEGMQPSLSVARSWMSQAAEKGYDPAIRWLRNNAF